VIKASPKGPRVTVVMNYLYNPEFLSETLASVYAQSFQDWEIVLWDNGSETDIAPIVAPWDERLRWIRTDDTVPLGEARNRAIEAGRGSLTAFLDADDIWHPDKLARQVDVLDRPSVGVTYTGTELFWPDGCAVDKYAGQTPPTGDVTGSLMLSNFTVFSSIVVRSEVLARERFDPRLSAMEDTDWLIRASRDWDFEFVPGRLCRYRQHSASFSARKTRVFREEHRLLAGQWAVDFPDEWGQVGQQVLRGIHCDEALLAWREGNAVRARQMLRGEKIQSLREAKVYLASFLSPSVADRMQALFTGRGTLPSSTEGA
jgi:glycosyltransferase involved in cell wall biosynthesis